LERGNPGAEPERKGHWGAPFSMLVLGGEKGIFLLGGKRADQGSDVPGQRKRKTFMKKTVRKVGGEVKLASFVYGGPKDLRGAREYTIHKTNREEEERVLCFSAACTKKAEKFARKCSGIWKMWAVVRSSKKFSGERELAPTDE